MEINITSTQNELIKHLVKLGNNSKYRYECHRVILEGKKLIDEICSKRAAKNLLLLPDRMPPKNVQAEKIVHVSEKIMKKVSKVVHSDGFFAELDMPKEADLTGKKYILALDQIRDPGNMGTLLRCALALGWEGAFILDKSVDPFNPKTIQAAMGATFRLPIATGTWLKLKQTIQKNNLQPLVADINGVCPEKLAQNKQSTLLILSNETFGPSKHANKFEKTSIPMPGPMESLNVASAGSILMYLLKNE